MTDDNVAWHPLTTAYHESGHAIVAISVCRPFTTISIEPEGDKLGEVLLKKPGLRWDWQNKLDGLRDQDIDSDPRAELELRDRAYRIATLRQDLFILFAGPLGERYHTKRLEIGGTDKKQVEAASSELAGLLNTNQETCKQFGQYGAKMILEAYEHALPVVAGELFAKRQLSFTEFDILLRDQILPQHNSADRERR